jgi:DNA-binding transcriptional LysR family regulator
VTATFNQLSIFAAVAKHSSITKAAAELRMSQPSISLQIKRLEEEFRVKLHIRKGRSIELTAQGRDLLVHAHKILAEIDQLNKSFKGNNAAVDKGSLVVGGSFSLSASLLPSAMQTFIKSHPHINPQLITGSKTKIVQMVLKFQIDIAVINDHPESPLLVAEPFLWQKIVVFVPADHLLARKSKLELSDILRFPLVVGTSGAGNNTLMKTIEHAAGQTRVRIGLRCDTAQAVKAAVRQGAGPGILYEGAVKNKINSGEFTVLKFPGSTTWGNLSHIIYHSGRPLSPATKEFLVILREKKARGKKTYKSPKGLEMTFPTRPPADPT